MLFSIMVDYNKVEVSSKRGCLYKLLIITLIVFLIAFTSPFWLPLLASLALALL